LYCHLRGASGPFFQHVHHALFGEPFLIAFAIVARFDKRIVVATFAAEFYRDGAVEIGKRGIAVMQQTVKDRQDCHRADE